MPERLHFTDDSLSPKHLMFLVFVNLIFAASLAIVKIGMDYMPPILFTAERFFICAMILAPFLKWRPGHMHVLFAIAMTAGAFSFALIYIGINVAGNLSSVVLAAQLGVPFTTIFAIVFLGEVVRWRRWLGMGFAFLGVMIISFDPKALSYVTGMLFGIAGAIVGASSAVLMRRFRSFQVFELQAWIAMFSWPVLLVMSIFIDGNPIELTVNADWRVWPVLAFTVLGSNLIAHAGNYYLLQRYEASLLAPFGLLTPVFAVIMGVLWLGDILTLRMTIGGFVTLIGVLIISMRQAHFEEELVVNPEDGAVSRKHDDDETNSVSSPNFDERQPGTNIDILLLHYTGMRSAEEALQRLCDSEAKVSAHYFVDEDGKVISLVPEDKRAWHAGVSYWAGATDINNRSIGVEIVNPGHEFGYRSFPVKQMEAVTALCREIVERHGIPEDRVLGHSDVAPERKEDPGELFDWAGLAAKGVGCIRKPVPSGAAKSVGPGDEGEIVRQMQERLSEIGYRVDVTGSFDEQTELVLKAFQRHHRPSLINGIGDRETLSIIGV